jgi:chromosome segregation ATPase
MEIDRERTAAAKLHKELDALRASADQSTERHRIEVAMLQEQLGNYRQRAGELEGNLKAVTASRDLAFEDLKVLRSKLEDRIARMTALDSESAELREKLEQAQRVVEHLQNAAKPPRSSRKQKNPETT